MKKLKPNDFLKELTSSNSNNLFIVPSVDSKRLFMNRLKYDKVNTEINTFGEIYFKYVRKNFLNLADEPIKKYYFTIALSEEDGSIRDDEFYNIIQKKASLDLDMDLLERRVYKKYRELLLENGFIEKSDVMVMILKSNYISTLKNYKKIFFMKPRYTSLKEEEIVREILHLDNTITMDFDVKINYDKKYKHYIADDIDFLLYKIAGEIIDFYNKNPNVKIAIITETKKMQNKIAKTLGDYNIFTNMPIVSSFYNINAVRESLKSEINRDNVKDYFENLKANLTDEIFINYKLEEAFDRIIENVKKYDIEYPKIYIEQIFKTMTHKMKYESNIHILNPTEIVLDYDYIYQIGLSDGDFMPSDEFSSDEIIGTISYISSHSDEFKLCTYDTNSITKTEFLMLDLEKVEIRNFEWIKDGAQITNLQKEYFRYVPVNNARKENDVTDLNNTVSFPLRSILSASKIDGYQKCAFKYFCDYIVSFDIERDEMYTQLGSFAHEVLERYFEENSYNFFDQVIFERLFDLTKLKYPDLKEFQFEMLKTKLKKVIISECMHGNKTLFTEKKFEHNFFKDKEGNDITFVGKIDRVDLSEEGYVLIDYKLNTSTIPSKPKVLSGEALQLPIYIAKFYDEIDSALYVDIKTGERKAEIVFGEKLDKAEFMKLCSENIKEIVANMDSGIINRTEDNNACRYCEYMDFCKRFWND